MEGMLNYFVPEDGDSSDHLNVVPLPRVDLLRLQHIKKSFPLPGNFHFRFKTAFEGTYVWLDVVNDTDPVPDFDGLIICKISRVQSKNSMHPAEQTETLPKAQVEAPDLIQTLENPLSPDKRKEESPIVQKTFNDDLVGLLSDPVPSSTSQAASTTSPVPPTSSPPPSQVSHDPFDVFAGNSATPMRPTPISATMASNGPRGLSPTTTGNHSGAYGTKGGFNAMNVGGPSPMVPRGPSGMNISQMHLGMSRGMQQQQQQQNSFQGLQWQEFHRVTISRDVFEVRSHYVNLRPVGGGSYGIVCSAEDTLRGRKVAIKKITDVFDDLTDAKRILREMKLLRHLGVHENIINILEVILVPPNVMDFQDIYIVTDLMESDLERIISSSQPLSDAHFQYFLYQILRGMKFVHSGNVLHRDLKPSNLLVNSNCDLSICDFGLARGVETAFNEDLTEYVVTRWYRAPELLTDCQNYNDAVDVWAIGCIFAEMLRRRPFFTGRDPSDQLHMIIRVLGSPTEEEMAFVPHEAAKRAILQHGFYPKRPLMEFFPDANPLAVDLLSQMLKFNPAERISVVQALAHPYLAQLQNPTDEPVCAEAFNFDFERESLDLGVEMPKEELQRLVFQECMSIHEIEAHQ
ncbi:hypothetical protein KXD40_003184 [Peronospora effusa]|nr:hypothetical protein KXD40_003184 [Peronospora effusa]